MTQKVLIVVADAARARIYTAGTLHRDPIALTHVEDFLHPESRQKHGELLDSDRSGDVHGDSPERDLKGHMMQQFAKTLLEASRKHYDAHACQALCMVAPPAFLGVLQKQLACRPQELHTLDKDYTHCDAQALSKHLVTNLVPFCRDSLRSLTDHGDECRFRTERWFRITG